MFINHLSPHQIINSYAKEMRPSKRRFSVNSEMQTDTFTPLLR